PEPADWTEPEPPPVRRAAVLAVLELPPPLPDLPPAGHRLPWWVWLLVGFVLLTITSNFIADCFKIATEPVRLRGEAGRLRIGGRSYPAPLRSPLSPFSTLTASSRLMQRKP